MAALIVSSRAPRCSSCIHRISGSFEGLFRASGQQQIRGKKRLIKTSTINVHLLRNVVGYGRRGAVVPVTAGRMRNIWFPRKQAEYLTAARMQELGMTDNAKVERDGTFGSNSERKAERVRVKAEQIEKELQASRIAADTSSIVPPQTEEVPVTVEAKLLSPNESMTLLEKLLPPNVDFFRTPIAVDQPTRKLSPSLAANSDVAIAAGKGSQKSQKTSFYGSVSTSDIAANLKAILAEDEMGERVTFDPEDIAFVEQMEDKDRVKYLGIYEFEIRLKGASDVVNRTIQIHAQD